MTQKQSVTTKAAGGEESHPPVLRLGDAQLMSNRKSQVTEGRHMLFKNVKVDGLNIFYREAGYGIASREQPF